ncbi:glycoside hydrolase family 43 protein [Limibacter armeniacum]|uniref:glycoside hydrolase family 43 protein n=1 Tax=Limibacter armeniacum TaxID=466084 RepID=UPI002FE548A8
MQFTKTLVWVATLLFLSLWGWSQDRPAETFKNPILSGFHPDPSICRVGDDYFLVNSSFEWFPGIPIFHSKDLVNWEQIGYVLDRPSQLMMETTKFSAGIWAPTIRYHNGKFYVVVTCKQSKNDCNCGNNFYVTADTPAGPWSEPVWIKDSKGIDPTIFWDEDGKVYYVGSTHDYEGAPKWKQEHRIYLQELKLETGELLGEPIYLTSGHAAEAKFTEGPHIYKIKDKYLLMVAEGGTWNNHAVTAFEADKITGPYTALTVNPVLTHRHLGHDSGITTIGHADLVQTQNGDWWSVMLGVRPMDGKNYYLGRETFLTPVKFEGITPIFNPGYGRVLMADKRPDLPWTPFPEKPVRDDFITDKLGVDWSFLRTPQSEWYHLEKGKLTLQLRPETTKDVANPSLIARRLEHHQFEVFTQLTFKPKKSNEVAGLVAMQNQNFQYRLELGMENKKDRYIALYKVFSENRKEQVEKLVAKVPYGDESVVLGMHTNKMDVQFTYGPSKEKQTPIGSVQSMDALCSNHSGGFIGAFVGMYASSQGQESKHEAIFDWFDYTPLTGKMEEVE